MDGGQGEVVWFNISARSCEELGTCPPVENRSKWKAFLRDLPALHQLSAALVGGMITAIVVNPFDVVKTRLQAQITSRTKQMVAAPAQFTGSMDAAIKIVRAEGITALWSGLRVSFAMSIPATAVYFTIYENLRNLLEQQWGTGTYSAMVAGGGARMITATLTCPLELVRTNMQAHAKGDPHSVATRGGIFQTLGQIQREQGIARLWAGLPPTILRDAPFSAIYWSAYEYMKRNSPFKGYEKNSFVVTFTSGATAGMLAAVLTTPIDVIKTRRQMHIADAHQHPVHILSIFSSIWRNEGPAGLLKGMVPRAAKVAPACAIMISSYELFKRLIADTTK